MYKPPLQMPFQRVLLGPVESVHDYEMIHVMATVKTWLPDNPFDVRADGWYCRPHTIYCQQRVHGLAWKNAEYRAIMLDDMQRELANEMIKGTQVNVRSERGF